MNAVRAVILSELIGWLLLLLSGSNFVALVAAIVPEWRDSNQLWHFLFFVVSLFSCLGLLTGRSWGYFMAPVAIFGVFFCNWGRISILENWQIAACVFAGIGCLWLLKACYFRLRNEHALDDGVIIYMDHWQEQWLRSTRVSAFAVGGFFLILIAIFPAMN